jgi:hypothetical protein
VKRFRDACNETGRGDVPMIFFSLKPPSYETLMQYRDLGVSEMVFNSHIAETDHAAFLRGLDGFAELRRKVA